MAIGGLRSVPPALESLVISDEEIAALNRAREILDQLEQRCRDRGWKAGMDVGRFLNGEPRATDFARVETLATVAADAVFNVLNSANSHRVRELSRAQLHGGES